MSLKIRSRVTQNTRKNRCCYQHPKKINFNKLIDRLKKGFDIDAPQKNGDTFLHAAVRKGDQVMVQILLQYGASTTIKTRSCNGHNETALHLSAMMGSYIITKLLLTEKMNFTVRSIKMQKKILQYAVQRGNSNIVKYLLQNVNIRSITDEKVRKLFFTKEESPVNLLTNNGKSALSLSISSCTPALFELLLEHGANINQMVRPQTWIYVENQIAPLHLIVYEDIGSTFTQTFIKLADKYKADKNITTGNGLTALHIAVMRENLELVNVLLDWNVDVNMKGNYKFIYSKDDTKILTPLHIAVGLGNVGIVKSLLCRKDIDVNAIDQYGESILLFAIRRQQINIISYLLQYNVDINYRMASKGLTALHYAIHISKRKIFDILIKHGADVKMLTSNGDSSLHIAVQLNNYTIVKRCLDLGITVDFVNKNTGNTALHYAAIYFRPSAAKLLLKSGANVNALNIGGISALEFAITNYNRQNVSRLNDGIQADLTAILLNAGANICLIKKFPVELLFGKSSFSRVLLEHVIKLHSAKMRIHKDIMTDCRLNLNAIFAEKKKFVGKCRQEIELIKKEKIYSNSFVIYYHYLVKSIDELSSYANNTQIVKFFRPTQQEKKFRIYGAIIASSFKRSVVRCKLVQISHGFLCDIFKNLPIVVIKIIISFLSNNDLRIYENYMSKPG